MNTIRRIALSLVLVGTAVAGQSMKGPTFAEMGMPTTNVVVGNSRAAACSPAVGLATLAANNVEALIETGGNMWQNRATSRAAYEVPRVDGGNGPSALYAGALWLGGVSPDQQLKLAAVTFRGNGNDFWPGPLTNTGAAEVTSEVCEQYDRFFVSGRRQSELHRLWFDLQSDPEQLAIAFPEGYSIPAYFNEYPAMGSPAAGQDLYLAPFKDYDGDGFYNPDQGDYPWYDFLREIDCKLRRSTDPVPLFGDSTYYWIFNDKGNIHTESGGLPIGMEIRAQAFAFSTTDEVNNMTFLNYVLINQGTQTLTNTYFGSWVDPDLGNSTDDYVGCDVQRGLGYCYNGDDLDETSANSLHYGENPPAVGIDFFEGPYQDADSLDNPRTDDIIDANDSLGIPYRGLGIGYGDGIVDNERFGMRRFVYYNIGNNPVNGEPLVPLHFYNYMRGIWKNNSIMRYGGNGAGQGGGTTNIEADYMFPGDSDPLHWGTGGVDVPFWTEQTADNQPGDRRFIQAAGPFTLLPGSYNNITLGVVWARSFTGEAFESVLLLREADDKAQSLFDNCFELVSGPDAPDVAFQELNREVILMLSNDNPISTNYQEGYGVINQKAGFDPGIPEELADGTQFTLEERTYKFQGYLVYQLVNSQVGANDLEDIERARLVAQCDIQDGVDRLINYTRDATTGMIVPNLKVDGANQGLQRSFRITEDAFATGTKTLVNHKTYYFMVIAYGYNNYLPYDIGSGRGQDDPFIASRKSALGEIPVIAAIPHIPSPEANGTVQNANYGDGVMLTQIEGVGNGTNSLMIAPSTERAILENGFVDEVTYMPNKGPVKVKVVDPLRLTGADYELSLTSKSGLYNGNVADSLHWVLYDVTNDQEVFSSFRNFKVAGEEVLVKRGISIDWGQYAFTNPEGEVVPHYTDFVEATYEFADNSKPWLAGIPDQEGFTEFNWIRAGQVETEGGTPANEAIYDDYKQGSSAQEVPFTDPGENYEKILSGIWAPYCLVSYSTEVEGEKFNNLAPTNEVLKGDMDPSAIVRYYNIYGLNNVDLVITSDKSKWSRCPVFELQSDPALCQDLQNGPAPEKMKLRRHPSVDKNGDADGSGTFGMGWFPGYAIDVTTGERLNVGFGEDSWLTGDNGRDMIWNPSSGFLNFGGQHYVYIFKNSRMEEDDNSLQPRYDEGAYMYGILSGATVSQANWKRIFRSCTWVGAPLLNPQYSMLSPEQGLIPNDVRLGLRVAKPFRRYNPNSADVTDLTGSRNNWRNLYSFSTKGLEPTVNSSETLSSVLDIINVVPNPYYAFSTYETSKLDNRVKITNLPRVCTVSIFDMNGTLIRQFKKGDDLTSLDWDLKNFRNVPIASGTYIIHVDVPGAGEKVLKWFGVMRPIDLQNF
jgi:hypothetical protein